MQQHALFPTSSGSTPSSQYTSRQRPSTAAKLAVAVKAVLDFFDPFFFFLLDSTKTLTIRQEALLAASPAFSGLPTVQRSRSVAVLHSLFASGDLTSPCGNESGPTLRSLTSNGATQLAALGRNIPTPQPPVATRMIPSKNSHWKKKESS
jgi:hypothetical protein